MIDYYWIDAKEQMPEINAKDSEGSDIRYLVVNFANKVLIRTYTSENEDLWKYSIKAWTNLPIYSE